MKHTNKHSLRSKIGKIIAIFSLSIMAVYTIVMLLVLDWGLSNGAGGTLWQESRLFLNAYNHNKNAPLPAGRSINGYIHSDQLPRDIQILFAESISHVHPSMMFDRFYQLVDTPEIIEHHDLMISTLPDGEGHFYLHYKLLIPRDVGLDIWDKMYFIAIGVGLIVIIMLLIFRKFIQRSLSPIIDLANWIDRIKDDKPLEKLPNNIPNNEIGAVAHSLFQALERINQANQREKQFLRNASHELRTPIAIIRSTMDVIEYKQQSGISDIDQLLGRIRRASNTMKSVTEAILWLAVENYSPPTKDKINPHAMIEELVTQNQFILDGRNVDIDINVDSLAPFNIEKSLVYIVFDNLIRNAFQHTGEGKIIIQATTRNTLFVKNIRIDVSGQTALNEHVETGGFGLGLALVKHITEKMQWPFKFELKGDEACATLTIPTNEIESHT